MSTATITYNLSELEDLEEIIHDAINYWEEELRNQEARTRIQRYQISEVMLEDTKNTRARIERYYELIWEIQDRIMAIRGH